MATNYHLLIYDLVSYKNELYRVPEAKFQPLIAELKKFSIIPESNNENLPSHKTLGAILNYKLPKISKLIKELHAELILDFGNIPLKITEVIHVVHIHYSYGEVQQMSKEVRKRVQSESTWIELGLPRTLAIGDYIDLEFIREFDKFGRGCVHKIEHQIKGNKQIVYLEVHPLNNYYYKWISLKEEYERWERDRKRWTQLS